MAIIATNKGASFKPVPEGTHIARCIGVYDLGTQDGTYGMARKVLLTFEIPEHTITVDDEERPMVISRTYTLSTHPKSDLRKHLEAWSGRTMTEQEAEAFDVGKLLGKACMVTVTHKEKEGRVFANIAGITQLHRGLQCPPAYNDQVQYEIAMGREGTFTVLPAWVQERIVEALELNPMVSSSTAATPAARAVMPEAVSDDLPF